MDARNETHVLKKRKIFSKIVSHDKRIRKGFKKKRSLHISH